MDNLKDKRGRITDIYVKLIPREKATTPLMGASFFLQNKDDRDAHNSRYGPHSVSIEIWIGVERFNSCIMNWGIQTTSSPTSPNMPRFTVNTMSGLTSNHLLLDIIPVMKAEEWQMHLRRDTGRIMHCT
jgi:hypothetical protein